MWLKMFLSNYDGPRVKVDLNHQFVKFSTIDSHVSPFCVVLLSKHAINSASRYYSVDWRSICQKGNVLRSMNRALLHKPGSPSQ